jgi:hypothetical protein
MKTNDIIEKAFSTLEEENRKGIFVLGYFRVLMKKIIVEDF